MTPPADLRVNTIFWRAPDPDDWIGDAKVGANGGTLTFSSSNGAYHSFSKRGRC